VRISLSEFGAADRRASEVRRFDPLLRSVGDDELNGLKGENHETLMCSGIDFVCLPRFADMGSAECGCAAAGDKATSWQAYVASTAQADSWDNDRVFEP
jgi:hypothetical protein